MAEPGDGIHRRADFVAHAGQEIRLGPVRLACFGNRFLQGTRAVLNAGFQGCTIAGKFLITGLQAIQHLIEAFAEAANLVAAGNAYPFIQTGIG